MVQHLDGTLVRAEIGGQIIRFFIKNRYDAIQHHHYDGVFYEREELDIMARHFKPHGVFVDIGANVGNHTLYAAKYLHAGQVIPFEVNADAIEILLANVALNDCRNVDTSLLGVGVAACHGLLTRVPDQFDEATNLGGARFVLCDEMGSRSSLPAIPADSVLAQRAVDFIKIDIEGMEMEALAGLEEVVSRRRPAIFAEIEDSQYDLFTAWFKGHGYVHVDQLWRYPGKLNHMIVPA